MINHWQLQKPYPESLIVISVPRKPRYPNSADVEFREGETILLRCGSVPSMTL
jgi:hypothetical protein